MRQILLFCFLMCFSIFAKAQYVAIPDSGFRVLLKQMVPDCFNENDLLDTNCTKLINVVSIYITPYPNIYDITGIKYCKYLKHLSADNCYISFLPELPASLKSISFYETYAGDTLRNLPSGITDLIFLLPGIKYIEKLPDSLINLQLLEAYGLLTLSNLPTGLKSLECGFGDLRSVTNFPDSIQTIKIYDQPYLYCLPKLPLGLQTLLYDTSFISCVPNTVPAYPDLPICVNPGDCSILSNDCVWTGTASPFWEDPYNWSCRHVPDANSSVTITSGEVRVSSNVTVSNLNISSGASINVKTGFNITITH